MAIYFISGTTRGIGRALVSSLLQRADTTVVAGVRDPGAETARSLNDLPKASGSRVIVVKLDSTSETDANDAVNLIEREHDIHSLDVVIANAGYAEPHELVGEVSIAEMRKHFEINTLGPLLLFQGTLPLLQKAKEPKFVVTSSLLASTTLAPQFTTPLGAYGVSKAAVNHLLRKAVGEYPDVAFVAMSPGLVATEMGQRYAARAGMVPIEIDESIEGYLKVLDKPVDEIKGKFLSHNGAELSW